MVCPMCSQLVERQMQLRVLYVDADNVSKYEGGGDEELFGLQGQPDDYFWHTFHR